MVVTPRRRPPRARTSAATLKAALDVSGGLALVALALVALALVSLAWACAVAPDAERTRVPALRNGLATLAAERVFSVAAARLAEQSLWPVTVAARPHPLADIPLPDFRELFKEPIALGPISFGRPNSGRLINGEQLASNDVLSVVNPETAWGTPDTLEGIREAATWVARSFGGASKLYVGDISRQNGGPIRHHRSHQSGRDVDLGYFYLDESKWYTPATFENLDRARTWALIERLISSGNAEYFFIDRGVQALLREYALATGEDPAWLETLFDKTPERTPLIRHTWGHQTHFHVRLFDNLAEEAGRLAQRLEQRSMTKRPVRRRVGKRR
jgi:hypothetical protein